MSEFRELGENEIIQNGDEVNYLEDEGGWTDAIKSIGHTVKEIIGGDVIGERNEYFRARRIVTISTNKINRQTAWNLARAEHPTDRQKQIDAMTVWDAMEYIMDCPPDICAACELDCGKRHVDA